MSESPPEFSQAEKEALLSEAFDKWDTAIVNFLTKRCGGDRKKAEDIAQELWLYVYQTFDPWHYDNPRKLLFCKAKNLQIDSWRRENRQKRPPLNFVDELPPQTVSENTVLQTPEQEEEFYTDFWGQFRQVDITESQKRIFWMKIHQGYSMEEIAEKTGIPRSTAHDHLQLVKSRCVAYLNQTTEHDS